MNLLKTVKKVFGRAVLSIKERRQYELECLAMMTPEEKSVREAVITCPGGPSSMIYIPAGFPIFEDLEDRRDELIKKGGQRALAQRVERYQSSDSDDMDGPGGNRVLAL